MKFCKHIFSMLFCTILILAFVCTNVPAEVEKLLLSDGSAIPSNPVCNIEFVVKYTGSEAVYYAVSDTSRAEIDKNTGKLKTLNPGEVRISAISKSDNKEKTYKTIDIKRRAETIELNYSKIYFERNYGGSFGSLVPILKATLGPSDTTDIVKYSSSNSESIVARSDTGTIIAKKAGSAVITVTSYLNKLASTTGDDPDNITATAQVFAHEHRYAGSYTASDSFYHYRKCINDGCTAVDDTKKGYYSEHRFFGNICGDCGYKRKPIEGHTHAWNAYGYDQTKHWLVCTDDGCETIKSPEIHNFGSDNKCSVCGITHEHDSWEKLYSLNSDAHWYACEKCDARKNMVPHHTDKVGDCKTPISCSDCGVNYGFGNHVLSEAWSSYEYNHSRICTVCIKQIISAPHTWTKDGDDKIKCSVCDRTHTHEWGDWTAESYGHKRSCSIKMLDSYGKVVAFENETYAHEFDSNGICTVCGYEYNPDATDNVYKIDSLAELNAFASEINRGKSSLNAILTEDIDAKNENITIIIGKSEGTPFRGVFDGNGKEIKNINFSISQDNAGLFGVVDSGTVKNLKVSGNINLSSENEYVRIGGIAGTAKNGAVFSGIESNVNISGNASAKHVGGIVGSSALPSGGTLTIDKCIYSGNINVPNVSDCIGGILGYANNDVAITNCGFVGSVKAKSGGHTGGILGYINNARFGKLENCYSAGETSGAAVIGTVKKSALNIENNVVSTGAAICGGSKGSEYSAHYTDDWLSGEAVWLLNKSNYDGSQIWYQNIGKSYPSFSGDTVYLAGCREGKNVYTNEPPKAAAILTDSQVTVMYTQTPCVLVLALYKDGKLVDTAIDSISEPTTKQFKDYNLRVEDADCIKAMVFGDLNGILPLCIGSDIKM